MNGVSHALINITSNTNEYCTLLGTKGSYVLLHWLRSQQGHKTKILRCWRHSQKYWTSFGCGGYSFENEHYCQHHFFTQEMDSTRTWSSTQTITSGQWAIQLEKRKSIQINLVKLWQLYTVQSGRTENKSVMIYTYELFKSSALVSRAWRWKTITHVAHRWQGEESAIPWCNSHGLKPQCCTLVPHQLHGAESTARPP